MKEFYYFEEYDTMAKWCNSNNYGIMEIKPDKIGRRFKIFKNPEPSKNEQIHNEINCLKEKLNQTDYKAIKFAEGILTLAEYEPTREQRKKWREEINFLENSLKNV